VKLQDLADRLNQLGAPTADVEEIRSVIGAFRRQSSQCRNATETRDLSKKCDKSIQEALQRIKACAKTSYKKTAFKLKLALDRGTAKPGDEAEFIRLTKLNQSIQDVTIVPPRGTTSVTTRRQVIFQHQPATISFQNGKFVFSTDMGQNIDLTDSFAAFVAAMRPR